MKGIVGDLGVIKIPLKVDAKPCKQRPYKMNPRYKEKVQVEINRMLDAGIIEPVGSKLRTAPDERGCQSWPESFAYKDVQQNPWALALAATATGRHQGLSRGGLWGAAEPGFYGEGKVCVTRGLLC